MDWLILVILYCNGQSRGGSEARERRECIKELNNCVGHSPNVPQQQAAYECIIKKVVDK